MTNKFTLVFDGNFWLHKTFFIGQKIKQGKPFNFIDEPEQDKNLLLWKLSTDFSAEIKRFESITNRIVYTIDSSSWRKKYHPESDYKSNRQKSSDIDWGLIYQVHDEFIKSIESLGIIVSRVKEAEADDLIFAWSSYLNQQGQNSLIISGDNDLLQLTNRDKSSDASTLYYNKFDKNLHTYLGFENWLNSEESNSSDIFNLPMDLTTNIKLNLKEIIKSNKMKIDEVDTNQFIFKKILIGDSGDNVSPLYTKVKETKNGSKTYRVTDNHANQILEEFKKERIFVSQSHFFEDESIDQICKISHRILKAETDLDTIKNKWKLNRDLVFLHKKCIPTLVINDMLNQIEEKFQSSMIIPNLESITNKDSILEKTTYIKEKLETLNDSSIFKNTINEKQKVETVINSESSSGFNGDFWNDLLK